MSLAKQLAIAAKQLAGIVSHGTIFDELKKANGYRIGTEERAKAIAAVEEKLDKFDRAQVRPTEEDLQILINLKVLLDYYKARNIEDVFEKNQEYYRLKKEELPKMRSFLASRTPVNPNGTLVQSAQAITSASVDLLTELMRNPEIQRLQQGFEAEKSSIPATATSSTATNRFLSAMAREVAAEQGARFAKAPTGTINVSKAGRGGRRQTRRKHRKGKKSTRRR